MKQTEHFQKRNKGYVFIVFCIFTEHYKVKHFNIGINIPFSFKLVCAQKRVFIVVHGV